MKDFGLGSESLSYTVIIGSPIGALVLYLYTNSIKKNGIYWTMLISNISCIFILALVTIVYNMLQGFWGRLVVLFFYSFREIYVTLISTQQWSFIATVLNKSKSSYMVQYSGLISITSAFGGLLVEYIVGFGGVRALLFMALVAAVLSCVFDEIAYCIVSDFHKTKALMSPQIKHEEQKLKKDVSNQKQNFWMSATQLILSNETLRILFYEALAHQWCANMLNLIFYDGLRQSIPDGSLRAVVIGRFFATVNGIASVLQCFVLPYLLSTQTLPQFLIAIPLLVFIAIIYSFVDTNALFLKDTIAFGTVKVLEYSIMTSATEMMYMPLDYEKRYIGKEFIRFFGHRLGKSAASITLSTMNAKLQWSHFTQSRIGILLVIIWEVVMISLAYHMIIVSESGESNKPTEASKPSILTSRSMTLLPWTSSNNLMMSNSTSFPSQVLLKTSNIKGKDSSSSSDIPSRGDSSSGFDDYDVGLELSQDDHDNTDYLTTESFIPLVDHSSADIYDYEFSESPNKVISTATDPNSIASSSTLRFRGSNSKISDSKDFDANVFSNNSLTRTQ